jgi:hypothetical protein
LLARSDGFEADKRRRSLVAGTQLLLLAFVLPSSVHNAAALTLHAGLATTQQGQTVPLPNFERIRLVQLWTEGDYPVFSRYLASLGDGARALADLDQSANHVHVLDFVGPFSAGLGLMPPKGDSTWHHWGRTVNEYHYLPPETLLRDVRIVMEPKWPIEAATAEGLRRLYADYLSENYQLAQETVDWKIYVPREPAETVSQSYGSDQEDSDDRTPSSGG